MSRSSGDLWPGLNEPKGYSALLILVVDAGMDDPRRLGRQGRCDHDGAPGQRWQLTKVGRYWRSSPLNIIRCSPTASGQRGELVLLTLRSQRATVATSDGGAPCSSPRVNVRWLQGFSGYKLASVGSDCSPNLWRPSTVARIGGRLRATMVARVLALGVLRVKIRVI
jgi:hypothetical protein